MCMWVVLFLVWLWLVIWLSDVAVYEQHKHDYDEEEKSDD